MPQLCWDLRVIGEFDGTLNIYDEMSAEFLWNAERPITLLLVNFELVRKI